MKRKFILTTAIATSIMMGGFFAQTLVANAETINHVQPRTTINKIENNKIITNEVKNGEITNVEQLQKAITPKDAKLVSTKTVYVRVTNSKDSKDSKTKVFTKEQYKELKAAEPNNFVYVGPNGAKVTTGGKYSWMELSLEVYEYYGQYTAYGYYQWLSNPDNTYNDEVSMQGSGVSFNVGGSSLENIDPVWVGPAQMQPNVTDEDSDSSGCVSQVQNGTAGISYKFSLGGQGLVKPYGVITVPFNPGSQSISSQLIFQYIHNNTLIPINVKVGLGPISVTDNNVGLSEANTSIQINFR